jgi:hypothetical protein
MLPTNSSSMVQSKGQYQVTSPLSTQPSAVDAASSQHLLTVHGLDGQSGDLGLFYEVCHTNGSVDKSTEREKTANDGKSTKTQAVCTDTIRQQEHNGIDFTRNNPTSNKNTTDQDQSSKRPWVDTQASGSTRHLDTYSLPENQPSPDVQAKDNAESVNLTDVGSFGSMQDDSRSCLSKTVTSTVSDKIEMSYPSKKHKLDIELGQNIDNQTDTMGEKGWQDNAKLQQKIMGLDEVCVNN